MVAYSSNSNVVLFNNCKSLHNLTVALALNRDLITLGNNGFSLQLNCYPQTKPQATYRGNPMYWFQYEIAVRSNQVQWAIQYWSWAQGGFGVIGVKGLGFSPPNNWSPIRSASSNQVPAGSVMQISLKTDHNGNVHAAAFSITDPTGKVSSYKFPFPSDALCAIYGFQVNLVGPPSGTHSCHFTSGVGMLTYSVSSGELAVQNTNTCGGPQTLTAEKSNAVYGQCTASGVPAPKVLQGLLT
jgi:hypothetical protein